LNAVLKIWTEKFIDGLVFRDIDIYP
jgi:hypothetical protein